MKKRKRAKKSARRITAKDDAASAPDEVPSFWTSVPEALKSEEKLQALREEVLLWIRGRAEELEATLLRYNAFDMLANLMVSQLWSDPEKYKETTHGGLAAVVEYAALLYLKHPFSEGEVSVIDGPVLESVESKVRGILATVNFYYAAESLPNTPERQRGALDGFRYRTISHELMVRSPGYGHHQIEKLRALFQPVSDWLLSQLGFTIEAVLAVEEAIEQVTSRRLSERVAKSKEGERELVQKLHAARTGSKNVVVDDEFIRHLLTLPPKQARKHIRGWMTLWGTSYLGTSVYSFTAEEVATESGLPLERIQAVLNYFSLDFGSIPTNFYLPSPAHELRSRPFLHHDGEYLYPLPGSIPWAVQQRLEEALNPSSPKAIATDAKAWKRYEANRKDYLEREALRLLGHALWGADVHHELTYKVVENGVTKETELDGLVAYDTTLLLVEAKAGGFSAPARRGSKDRIKRDLKELFGKAHSQALRAKRYIESAESPVFVTKDGREIRLDKSRFHRVFLVTVTLEPMDTFNAVLHEVARAGVLEEAELPWAVSLDVLRVICEVNEFPTQLIHYLQRRLRVNEFQKFRASDELDWFGLYLARGLYFENDERFREADFVQFTSFSTPFDDYYLYEAGIRKTPAPKPKQPMPKLLRDIVLELEGRRDSEGRSEAVLQLINWNDETRSMFVRLYKRIRNMTRRDRQTHDFSFASSGAGMGVTCFSVTAHEAEAESAFERLFNYIQLKKYQARADRWLGLLSVVDYPGLIHGFAVGDEPWAFDEQMEEWVASLPSTNGHDAESD